MTSTEMGFWLGAGVGAYDEQLVVFGVEKRSKAAFPVCALMETHQGDEFTRRLECEADHFIQFVQGGLSNHFEVFATGGFFPKLEEENTCEVDQGSDIVIWVHRKFE